MKKWLIAGILLLLLTVGFAYLSGFLKTKGITSKGLTPALPKITNPLTSKKESQNTTNLPLKVSDNYSISIYADNLGNPRDLEVDPSGNLLVSTPGQGKVVKLPEKTVVVEGLKSPHGLAFTKDKLYIAETNQVAMYDYNQKTFKATNKKKIIDLPSGGNHTTRSILIKEDKIYISTGSSCNVCIEEDKRRAAIWVADLDGSDFKTYAQGLRNSVFMTLHPLTKDIWATDMGRDLIGDNIPPEEVNIVKNNNFYGWPYCYGDKVTDSETNKNNAKYDCNNSVNPQLSFQAHSAPLGLAFLDSDLLVAYHGSWNRTEPTGYKVVKFLLDKNGNSKGDPEDFLTGFFDGKEAWGRPADILVKDNNEIYISDDKLGVVYLLKI